MDWKDQLEEIVNNAQTTPTFQEWLATVGFSEIPLGLAGPVQVASLMRSLYQRYRREYPNAA